MKLLFWILTILAAILTWRESCVLGELTILQGSPFPSSDKSKAMARKLTCVSEDNLSALVWITKSRNKYKFVDSPTVLSTMDCSFDGTHTCTKQWNLTSNWTLTNSVALPMGPVMDSRWEGFSEYFSNGTLWTSGRQRLETYIFSVLGTFDLKIQFCVPASQNSTCYRIALGEKIGAKSFIQESTPGSSKFHDVQRIPEIECHRSQVSRQHGDSFWRLSEWKTFTMRYSERSKTVSVYDEAEQILSCNFTKWKTFHTSLWSPHNTSLRAHEYGYRYTTKAQEQLLSPWFDVAGSNICIEMVVGMCAECKLSIDLIIDEEYQITMGYVMSKLSSNGDGLLPWQHVRFNKSVQHSFGKRVRFQVVTHLLKNDPNPLWAVASIKKCKDSDAVRKSTMNITQVFNEERKEFIWPEVECQKLSYNGSSLVSTNSVIQHELKHDMPLCERGEVGPHCAITCSSIGADANCRNLSICIAEGCTCSHGWQGQNCDEEVPPYLTVKVLGKGMVILEWSYSWFMYNKVPKFNITIERIGSNLRQVSNQEKISSKSYHSDKYLAKFTKVLYLLPSTEYKFSVCPKLNEAQRTCVYKEAVTPAALAFKNDFKKADIPSDHTILVELPSISNNTLDSIMHIILNGEVLCENLTRVSDVLTSHINLTNSESAWIAARFETVGMKEQYFTIGDSQMYNGIFNCPLNPGETYDIVVIVDGDMEATENMTIVSNVLRVKLPEATTKSNLVWLISIPIIVALVPFTYYVYRKRNVILSEDNDIITYSLGTVNAKNLYVDPAPRIIYPKIPQSRQKSTHDLEVVNDIYSG